MNALSHPKSEQLTAYSLGKLPWSEVEKVENHLKRCEECRSQVAGLEGNADSFVSCLRDTRGEEANDTGLDNLLAAARSLTQPTRSEVSTPRQIVAGHELLRELARGGLGVVYLARHLLLHDLRAIKRPQTSDGLDRDILLARFRREVEAVGSLRHDHIVRAHDAGADAEGPYLVMEYLDGMPLSRLVAQRRLLPAQACALVRQAALGLQGAHERGLVHRDMKPSNLMLARAGPGARVVVIDWGLVKRADDSGPGKLQPSTGATKAGTAIGTADYIAPEQVRDSRSVDIRADIYSLGVTLYCLLARKPPFHGRPELEKLLAHQHEDFPPLNSVRADIPEKMLAIVKKMVAKDPAKRFASPAEVVSALQPFCVADSRLLELLEAKQSAPLPQPPVGRRIGWVLALAAGLLLAALSLGLVVGAISMMAQGQKRSGDGPNAENSPGVLGDGPELPVSMSDRHKGQCSSLVFMSDGLHAVSEDGGGEVIVWDLQKRRRKKVIPHQSEKPLPNLSGMVAVSPDSKYIAAAGINVGIGYMDSLSLFDGKTYALTSNNYRFDPNSLAGASAFSHDGSQLALIEGPGVFNRIAQPFFGPGKITVSLLDIKADKWKKLPVSSPVNGLAFAPDGQWLVTCSDEKSLRLWNLKEGRQEREIPAHQGGADQVAFSTDGKQIYSASAADDTLRVWNNDKDAREVRKIPFAKSTKMARCAFWPAGRALTGHADGSIILWDLDQGKELKRFSHKDVHITALAISPDGHHALAAHSDHNVYLYRLPPPRAKP